MIASIGSLTFGGVGLLTASRAQKIESVSGLINLVMMPMWIFSGVFFSYERFPAIIQPLIKALPLTALNDALRARDATVRAAGLRAQDGQAAGVPVVVKRLADADDADALLLTAKAYEQGGDQLKALAAYRRLYFYGIPAGLLYLSPQRAIVHAPVAAPRLLLLRHSPAARRRNTDC